jgi:GNAT superfamily N-acetyltransferase
LSLAIEPVHYRKAEKYDIPAMARIRAGEWGTEEYWRARIAAYMDCTLHPRHALMSRVNYVAFKRSAMVGLIAGHLTRRYACQGELEWINVIPGYRRAGVATALLRLLAEWFADQKAWRICVDVDRANLAARSFYMRHGACDLKPHWMVWNDIKRVLDP